MPDIILKGGDWYAARWARRRTAGRGWCAFRVIVNRPGVYEVPLGMNMMTAHQRDRRRRAGRAEAEGRDSGRQFVSDADGR